MKSDGLIWLNCCWLNSQPVDGDGLPISVRVESLALFITARGKIHPQQIKTKHKKARAVFIILVIYCVLIYLLHKSQNRSSVNMELRQKQWKQPCRIATYNMVGVAVAMVISTMHEKSCIDSHNARKFE